MSTSTLKLAIIGAGNAGVTMAAHAKLAGVPRVSLYDRHDHELSIIAGNNNQIKLEGNISPQGIATIDLLTTDPAELARDSNFYICDTPAFSHAAVVELSCGMHGTLMRELWNSHAAGVELSCGRR